jgi:GT2 family glycosyltransferase
MYSEDMDLCVKISKTGWKIYYVPDAMIIHHAGGSSASREESNFSSIMLRESLAHFFEVHQGRRYAAIYRSSTAFVSMCRISLLMAISPLAIHPRGYRFLSRTVRKWGGILAWSLGRTVWATRQPIRPAALVGTSQTTHQEVS